MGEVEVAYLASLVRCAVGSWPIKYLGLPLGGNPTKKIFWEPMITKVARRLDGWKRAFLSRGGRLTLIRFVLSSLPIYFLSLFRMPQGVANAIEKLMRDFLLGVITILHVIWSDEKRQQNQNTKGGSK